jgi:hypothetical protein
VPASYLRLRNVVKSYDGKSTAVDDLIRPERLRPCENGGAEQFAKVVDLTIEGTVNYGDSVLLIGKAGTIPLRVRASSAQYGSLREGLTLRVG